MHLGSTAGLRLWAARHVPQQDAVSCNKTLIWVSSEATLSGRALELQDAAPHSLQVGHVTMSSCNADSSRAYQQGRMPTCWLAGAP